MPRFHRIQPESEEEEGSDEEQASDFEAEELGGKKSKGKKAAGGSATKRGRKAKAEVRRQGAEGYRGERWGKRKGEGCAAAAAAAAGWCPTVHAVALTASC